MNTIGQIIKFEREKRSLTLKQLAPLIGVTYEGLWQMERYSQSIGFNTLDKVCNLFNLNKKVMALLNFQASKYYKEYERYVDSIKISVIVE